MNLSEHFTLEELTASDYAARHGIDNAPSPDVLANLEILAQGLERIREIIRQPITVTSGYRSPKVNAGIGGSRTSDHVKGLAADIKVAGIAPTVLAKIIEDVDTEIRYKQLIQEFGQWVHISFPDVDESPKLEVLTAKRIDGKVVYLRGIA